MIVGVRKLIAAAVTALMGATLLSACGSSRDDNFDDRANIAEPKLRFVHAVPAGPAFNLYRQDTPLSNVSNVDYKYGSQYFGVNRGVNGYSLHTVIGDREVATVSIDAQRGRKYTLVAFPTASGIELQAIDDPFSKSLTSDNARVRVINGSPNAARIDIYIDAPAVILTAASPKFATVGYKQVDPPSGSDSLQFEANTYMLRITEAGGKSAIFTKTINLPKNADWVLVTLAESGGAILRPNDVRVLLLRADDSAKATDELVTE